MKFNFYTFFGFFFAEVALRQGDGDGAKPHPCEFADANSLLYMR